MYVCVWVWMCATGIPQMVLLTKVDEACRSVGEDLKHVYQSHYIYKMVRFGKLAYETHILYL